MAKTIEQLEQELGKVSEDTRQAYDILNSQQRSGRYYLGLYRQLEVAKSTLKKKGVFESAKKEAEATIASLEPKIKKAEAEYKKFQEQKNELNKQIKAIKTEEKEKKIKETTGKNAVGLYTKALNELSTAELGLEGYKGEEDYIAAYQKAQQAFDDLVKTGQTPPKTLPSPKIELKVKGTGQVGADGQPVRTAEEIAAANSIGDFFNTLIDPANVKSLVAVQQDLKKNFPSIYKAGTNGIQDWIATQNAVTSILVQRSKLPKGLQGDSIRGFIALPTVPFGPSAGEGAGTGSGPDQWGTIFNKTQAKSLIESVVKSVLNRDATPLEISTLTEKLTKAQKDNPLKQVNGMTVGGVDATQFVTDLVKKEPEFAVKTKQAQDITAQTLAATARLNGISLTPAEIQNYSNKVKSGTDIKIVENMIRKTAALGQPEKVQQMLAEGQDLSDIYSPYRTRMAAILELNPDSIKLDDPALRQAIGPDKEMSIYDFQNQLRKDSRWQYTDQARKEVSSTAMKVLRDFGFEA